MADIFDEAESDYRAEQLRAAAARYGWVAAAVLVAALAIAGGWQFMQAREAHANLAAAKLFTADSTAADALIAGDQAGRLRLADRFVALAATAPPGYRTLARLRAAALLADAGHLPAAEALWDRIGADPAADPLLRSVASMLWVERGLDGAEPDALRTRLVSQTQPGDPFHLMARENQALLDLRQGKTAAARDMLRQLASDPAAARGVRGRATAILQLLGG